MGHRGGNTNGELKVHLLRASPATSDAQRLNLHPRPGDEALHAARYGHARGDAVAMLRTIAFDTVVAPQWHAAANHLPKISRALARRSGRALWPGGVGVPSSSSSCRRSAGSPRSSTWQPRRFAARCNTVVTSGRQGAPARI